MSEKYNSQTDTDILDSEYSEEEHAVDKMSEEDERIDQAVKTLQEKDTEIEKTAEEIKDKLQYLADKVFSNEEIAFCNNDNKKLDFSLKFSDNLTQNRTSGNLNFKSFFTENNIQGEFENSELENKKVRVSR